VLYVFWLSLLYISQKIAAEATTVNYVWTGKCYSGCVGKQTLTVSLPAPYTPWSFVTNDDFVDLPSFSSSLTYYEENSRGDTNGNPIHSWISNFGGIVHDAKHIELSSADASQHDVVFTQENPTGIVEYTSRWNSFFNLTRSGWLSGYVINNVFVRVEGNVTSCPPEIICKDGESFSYTSTPLLVRGRFSGDVTPIPLLSTFSLFTTGILVLGFAGWNDNRKQNKLRS
jgi:hypothetical protein